MTKSAAQLRSTFQDAHAHYEALTAHATANGVTGRAWEVMMALNHAAEFLEWAADMIADGRDVDHPEVIERANWARSKIVEATGAAEASGTTH
jgi:hypothetical protein